MRSSPCLHPEPDLDHLVELVAAVERGDRGAALNRRDVPGLGEVDQGADGEVDAHVFGLQMELAGTQDRGAVPAPCDRPSRSRARSRAGPALTSCAQPFSAQISSTSRGSVALASSASVCGQIHDRNPFDHAFTQSELGDLTRLAAGAAEEQQPEHPSHAEWIIESRGLAPGRITRACTFRPPETGGSVHGCHMQRDYGLLVRELVRALRGLVARRPRSANGSAIRRTSCTCGRAAGGCRARPSCSASLRGRAGTRPRSPRSSASRATSIPLSEPAVLADLLVAMRGGARANDIARRCGVSRYIASRWLSGATEPRLSEFLMLVDVLTLRLVDMISAFVPVTDLPLLAAEASELKRRRRVAFSHPWSVAVVREIETATYRRARARTDRPRLRAASASRRAWSSSVSPP